MTNAALVAAQLLADADAAMLRRKILLVCYTAVSTTLTVPAARKAQGHLARAGCRVRADHPFAKPQGNVSQRGPAGPVESTPGQRAIAGLAGTRRTGPASILPGRRRTHPGKHRATEHAVAGAPGSIGRTPGRTGQRDGQRWAPGTGLSGHARSPRRHRALGARCPAEFPQGQRATGHFPGLPRATLPAIGHCTQGAS